MTSAFINKVIKYRVVDTKKYRYVAKTYDGVFLIKRLPLEYLGTTLALTEWETVW